MLVTIGVVVSSVPETISVGTWIVSRSASEIRSLAGAIGTIAFTRGSASTAMPCDGTW